MSALCSLDLIILCLLCVPGALAVDACLITSREMENPDPETVSRRHLSVDRCGDRCSSAGGTGRFRGESIIWHA